MLNIVIVNLSSEPALTPGLLVKWTRAIAKQLAHDVAPLWRLLSPTVSYDPVAPPPPDASVIYLFDDADQAGALGYHDLGPNGVAYAKVFVRTILTHGGTIDDVSVTLSHEAIEMLLDPACSSWEDCPELGKQDAKEGCDAVEGRSYVIDDTRVSDFVTPEYFVATAPPDTLFDFMGVLTAPFTVDVHGYRIRRDLATGAISNEWGAGFPPWKQATKMHPASRTSRRAAP